VADPTFAESQALIKKITYLLHLVRDRAEVTSTTLTSQIDTVQQAVEGDFSAELLDAVEALRNRYASLMSEDTVRALLTPPLLHIAKVLDWPDTDPSAILTRLYEYMVTNSLTVKGRNISFGSVTAGGSNAGNGTVNRLVKDETNYQIEATTVEVKTLECIFDATSRTEKGEEEFEVRGESANKDGLETAGSGTLAVLRAMSARDTAAILDNPSFTTYSGTTSAPTAISGWTPTASSTVYTNLAIDTTNYYRLVPGETTGAALKISAADGVSQALSVRGSKLSPNVPYYLQVAYNRQVGSGSATLQISLGATTKSVVLAAQTGWNVLRLDLDQGLWLRRFNEQDLDIRIELTSYTSGYVLVDDVILVPMQQVDGAWYAVVGGSTPFLRRDTFTFTDTGGTSAIQQYWFWRGFGQYLPFKTDGSETWTDPP
jgi:hypothetical protein